MTELDIFLMVIDRLPDGFGKSSNICLTLFHKTDSGDLLTLAVFCVDDLDQQLGEVSHGGFELFLVEQIVEPDPLFADRLDGFEEFFDDG